MVSRALLAFQANEKHEEDGRFPSDDAELGALLTAEFQGAVLGIRKWLERYEESAVAAAEERERLMRLHQNG